MTERLMMTIVICVTVAFCTLIGSLAYIAIHQDGGSETTIVTMMVGLPALFIASGIPVFQHLFATKLGQKGGATP